MKRVLAALLATLLLCPAAGAVETSGGPKLSATCAVLVDAETGRRLFQRQADERRPIASITKLMTALVAIRSTPDLTREITIKREHTLAIGSSMYLRPGEKLSLETLLYGLLLVSGNDAALAVAELCAGDTETFVSWMNDWAEELGMENSRFTNPSGLPDENHYSTAADMARLAQAVLSDPVLAKIVSTRSITLGERSMTNHNKLLWQYEGCVGMKTGYTDEAGRTLVSAATREGQTLIAVTLKDPDDWRDHAALFDYGFAQYPRRMLALSGRRVRSLAVTGSLIPLVGVTTSDDVYYPLGEGERTTAKITLPELVEAPLRKGTLAGEMTFYLDGREIGRTYLEYTQSVAADATRNEGFLARLMTWLGRRGGAELPALFLGKKQI